MGKEVDLVLGKIAEEHTFRQSDPAFQFRAFSHLTLPVGAGYMKIPREAETTFKPLVEAYGIALRDLDPNIDADLDALYLAYSNLFEEVYDFNFGDQFQRLYFYPFLTELKLAYFRGTIECRRNYGDIHIHPENNAWMIIPYAFRHIVTNFDCDVVSAFKMIPFVDEHLSKPVVGWVQIPDTTVFKTISLFVDDDATVGMIVVAKFPAMYPFEGDIPYPLMYKDCSDAPGSRDFYIKADEVIFS
jgi:hypothetical protein